MFDAGTDRWIGLPAPRAVAAVAAKIPQDIQTGGEIAAEGRVAAQRIAFLQQGGHIGGQLDQAERRAAPQQVSQSRMGRQFRQRLSD